MFNIQGKVKMVVVLLVVLILGYVNAVETENHTSRILPAPGEVFIDGKTDDWDLSGGTFACGDLERYREQFGVWLHLMYDEENLYILGRWNDPTPLNNPQSSKGGYGFKGDCLQVRMIFNWGKEDERVTHMTAWQDKDGILTADLAYGRDFKGGNVPNITEESGQHAVAIIDPEKRDDAVTYIQEIAIPWKLIASTDWKPEAGASFRLTVEPNFTLDGGKRLTIKDLLYNPQGKPNRIFSFRTYSDWAIATLMENGSVDPQPLVTAMGDELDVKMQDGKPVVDWSPLLENQRLPGHKTIKFDMPFDGKVSMVIKNSDAEIVRHLLSDAAYKKGEHTVNWDGLATPMWKTPTDILPAGEYTWEAIAYDSSYKLTLNGWVDCHGVPWTGGQGDSWGGDHGAPKSITSYKDTMIMGWGGSEAGFGLIATDKKGRKLWHSAKGPTARGPKRLVVDGDDVIGYDYNIFKIKAEDGEFGVFARNNLAFVYPNEFWDDKAAPEGDVFPAKPDSLDADNGIIYVGFANSDIIKEQIKDTKKIAEFLVSGNPIAEDFFAELYGTSDSAQKKYKRQLQDYVDGKLAGRNLENLENKLSGSYSIINKRFLRDSELFPENSKLTGLALQKANLAMLSEKMGDVFKPIRTDFILKLDKDSGKIVGFFDIPAPTYICAVNKDLLYVISDSSKILAVNPDTGKYNTVLEEENLKAVALDPQGNLAVVMDNPVNQVVVYSTKGKELRPIGIKGGRPRLGPWQKDGMYNPEDIAFDSDGRMWIMEHDRSPKRVSVWNYSTGKNVDEFFGPTHYGASGGCINPLDPKLMISSGVEYRLDEDGRGHALQVITDYPASTFSTYVLPDNGKLYWVRVQAKYGKRPQVFEVFEKKKDGTFVIRSSVNISDDGSTEFWSDKNGDQKIDSGEVKSVPYDIKLSGIWWLNMDARNFTLAGVANPVDKTKSAKVFAYSLSGYTKCGAPVWNTDNPQELDYTYLTDKNGNQVPKGQNYGNFMPSLDNSTLLSLHGGSSRGGTNRAMLECFDMKTGERKWWYPNMWGHVHGGHRAPPPEPGLFQAAYGIIGQFVHPVVGNVWVVNTDKGVWHMISESGFYVGSVFQTDPMSRKFPENAVVGADMTSAPPGSGGEDFGGSVIQTKDGSVLIQSGKIAAWNLSIDGLDSITNIGSGKLTIKPSEIALAEKEYENQLQTAAGKKMLIVENKSINFTGNVAKDFGGKPLEYSKGTKTGVQTWVAYDSKKLYLAYEVNDPTPWVNTAGDFVTMYQSGDTVDFQFGADLKADRKRTKAAKGDLRLSVGNYKGTPTAVLYRKVWDEKKPREFTSGVIGSYIMDYVSVVESVEIKVNVDENKKLYTVEIAVPFAELGFTPDQTALYKADFGVTHGSTSGAKTDIRTYWSNQQTGLVDDAVYELMMQPQNWGELKFK